MTLRYLVQGSARQPYVVRFEGEGDSVKAFCSCPSGRNAGRFCKHIKAAIEGGPALVHAGSDAHAALVALVKGTALELKATSYVPPEMRERVDGYATVAEVYAAYRAAFEARGYAVTYREIDGEFPAHELALFAHFKNGKQRKTPSIVMTWEALTFDFGAMPDGTVKPFNVRPRAKPFGVSGKLKTGQWVDLAGAVHALLLNAGVVAK